MRYKPWTGDVTRLWENDSKAEYIKKWEEFKRSTLGQQKLPRHKRHTTETSISNEDISQSTCSQDSSQRSTEQEQWMHILEFEGQRDDAGENNFDAHVDAVHYTHQQIGEAVNWIRSNKEENQIKHCPSPVDVNNFTHEQKCAFDFLTDCSGDQKLVILNGTAGTGKSYLVHALAEHYKDRLKVTATTGVASFNIHGQTLCSLLKLPIRKKNKCDLVGEQLIKLQNNMTNVQFIAIDEYTMVVKVYIGLIGG